MTPDPHDESAESAVIAACILMPALLSTVFRTGLTADHFYGPRHRAIWTAICAIYDQGGKVDTVTVCAQLDAVGELEEVRRDYVETLVTRSPNAAHVASHAEIVVRKAELRRYRRYSQQMLTAVEEQDWDGIHELEGKLMSGGLRSRVTVEPEEFADKMIAWLKSPQDAFSTPWESLNALMSGGLRRGETTLVGAHSSHGKTVLLDQILRHASKNGQKCHLWINEHTIKARAMRYASASTGIPHRRIRNRELAPADWSKIGKAANDFAEHGYGITEAAGWTAAELARDIRNRRLDIAVVDIFHRIATPTGSTADWTAASLIMSDVTKEALGNCHLLMAVHLNEARVDGVVRKEPVLGDIRNTGMLKNDADYVMFVHREQDKTDGSPKRNGRIWLAKARDDDVGGFDVRFSPKTVEFIERESSRPNPAQESLEQESEIPQF